MIIDLLTKVSDEQAVTVTAPSTDYIDTIAAGDSYEGFWLLFNVNVLATAGGAATLTVELETDDNTGFASATVLVSSGAIPVASLVAGYQYAIRVPAGAERYLRVNYTVATGPLTAGNFSAAVVKDVPSVIA